MPPSTGPAIVKQRLSLIIENALADGTMQTVKLEFHQAQLILREGRYLLEPNGQGGSLMLKFAGVTVTQI